MDQQTIDNLTGILVVRCDETLGDGRELEEIAGLFCLIQGQGGIFLRRDPPRRDHRCSPKMLNALNF